MWKYQDELNEFLLQNKDKTYNYSFSNHCIGVRVPIVDGIAKEINKKDLAKDYLDTYEKTYMESDVIFGMLCGYAKLNHEERMHYLNRFLPLVDNWATCDLSVARWKFIKKDKTFYLNWVSELIDTNDPWYQRVAYVVLLSYYLDDEYVCQAIEFLKRPIQPYYYTEMAAAWLISMGLVKQKDVFIELLETHQFSDFVYQKGLQKAIESFRSTSEDKELYQQMKKERTRST